MELINNKQRFSELIEEAKVNSDSTNDLESLATARGLEKTPRVEEEEFITGIILYEMH